MLARAYSAGILGVQAHVVTVEASVGLGLPGLVLVGQVGGALQEARERVKSALQHVGHEIRPRKQVVNLAPADLRKDSPGIDLAIACSLLAGHGLLSVERLDRVMLWAELALDGGLRSTSGVLVVADAARRAGFHTLIVAESSAGQAVLVPGLRVLAAETLAQIVAHLRGEVELAPVPVSSPPEIADHDAPDLEDVQGLVLGRLAVEVMVAGGHNLLLHGPPGVGKTMLARRAGALFPALDREAALEVTKIHDVIGAAPRRGLVTRPPVRAPHHTVSTAGMLGGGTPVRPGEVTLAHRGLLFLDELPEMSRACLEGLREPLENGEITLVRSRYAVRLPARFQLLAAMNPCPCGFLGHPDRACVCPAAAVQRYQARVSGPLLDRIDLMVAIVPSASWSQEGESSALVRERIARARARQAERLRGTRFRSNAEIPADGGVLEALCPLAPEAVRLLAELARRRRLSLRAQHRLRRVARTLADLRRPGVAVDAPIGADTLSEAVHLRRPPTAEDT